MVRKPVSVSREDKPVREKETTYSELQRHKLKFMDNIFTHSKLCSKESEERSDSVGRKSTQRRKMMMTVIKKKCHNSEFMVSSASNRTSPQREQDTKNTFSYLDNFRTQSNFG